MAMIRVVNYRRSRRRFSDGKRGRIRLDCWAKLRAMGLASIYSAAYLLREEITE